MLIMKVLQKYTFQVVIDEDGDEKLVRTNEGFTALELLGIASMIQYEVNQMISGEMKPDRVERIVRDAPTPPDTTTTQKDTQ
jgi:hypothetical protein